jgi:hypothetical protein
MKKLSLTEKADIREMLSDDNKRIEHARTMGTSTEAANAKRAKHLRPSSLASLYSVSLSQILIAGKGLL